MLYGFPRLLGTHPALWGAVGYLAFKSKYDWKVVSGVRSLEEQANDYAIGRTTELDRETVTDAAPGSSAHNFGLAVDVQPTLDKGASVVQDTEHPAWAEKDKILGGFPGITPAITTSSGRDFPHLQVMDWQSKKEWQTTYTAVAACIGLVVILGAIGSSK